MHKYPEEIRFDENASGSLGPFIDMFNHQFGILEAIYHLLWLILSLIKTTSYENPHLTNFKNSELW